MVSIVNVVGPTTYKATVNDSQINCYCNGGDCKILLPDANATSGLQILVRKASRDSNKVLVSSSYGAFAYTDFDSCDFYVSQPVDNMSAVSFSATAAKEIFLNSAGAWGRTSLSGSAPLKRAGDGQILNQRFSRVGSQ